MARLLQRIFKRFTMPPAGPVLLISAPWSRTDQENWKRFLAGDTGRKLVQRMRAVEAANAIFGAKDLVNTAHAAGRSVGYGECLEHLISLSCARDGQRAENIGAPGAAPADESPEQRENREMAELLSRLSP